jgi:hypothetical protein
MLQVIKAHNCVFQFSCFVNLIRSQDIFMDYISGGLGERIILQYVTLVQDDPRLDKLFDATQGLLLLLFGITIWLMGDIWRRLVWVTLHYPYAVFTLIRATFEVFLEMIAELKQKHAACSKCLDREFTSVILSLAGDLDNKSEYEQRRCYKTIKDLLTDISIWAPISSDSVECTNGWVQNTSHKFRGRAKLVWRACAESFLRKVRLVHSNFVEALKPWFLPSKHKCIRKAFTAKGPDGEKGQPAPKKMKLEEAEERTPRALSGLLCCK